MTSMTGAGATTSGGRSARASALGITGSGARRRAARRRAAALEVRCIPAATLELETSGGEQLGIGRFATGRAIGERCIAHLLKVFLLEAAFGTAILVDWHFLLQNQGRKSNSSVQRAERALRYMSLYRECPAYRGNAMVFKGVRKCPDMLPSVTCRTARRRLRRRRDRVQKGSEYFAGVARRR